MKNIGGDAHDTHYRYKRNIIQVKALNKQGGLTQIVNMDTIRKQLGMPKEFVSAFFKKIKKKGHGVISPGVFRGTVSVAECEKVLEKMIVKFVLCPNCGNPEWAAGPSCPACGHNQGDKLGSKKKVRSETKVEPISVESMTKTMSMKRDLDNPEHALADLMHTLYDRREGLENTQTLDRLLDKCWDTKATPENVARLHEAVSQI
jgi:translation initiation factor 2 beta subunit (eIF-2beta)/eIF-5